MMTSMANKTYIMKGDSRNRALDTFHLILSPSYGCNMACKHCYLPSHSNKGMNYPEVKRIMTEWSEIVKLERGRMNGILHLKGGEPLALPYLYDIFDFLKEEKTCSLMITTNGTLGNETFFSEIKKLDEELENSTVVIVSLDGSQDEIHGLLRGEGNFYKTVQFIKELTEQGITVHVNYVVHKKNLFDLENFINLAMFLGVSQINFLKFIPKGFGQSIEEWAVDTAHYNQRMEELYETTSPEIKELLSGNLGYIIDQEKCGTCTSRECVGGYKGLFYILPSGDVFSCPNLTDPELRLGNVKTDALYDLHENSLNRIYSKIQHYKNASYLCKGEILKQPYVHTGYEADNYQDGISYCYSRNF
jgi:radical SAM protein with 4Fe4S-binding SPASM domain